jgi:hypothetical protein
MAEQVTPLKVRRGTAVMNLEEEWFERIETEIQTVKRDKIDHITMGTQVSQAVKAELVHLNLAMLKEQFTKVLGEMTGLKTKADCADALKREVEELKVKSKELETQIKKIAEEKKHSNQEAGEVDDGSGRLRLQQRKVSIGALKYSPKEGDVYLPDIMSKLSKAVGKTVEWRQLRATWESQDKETDKIMTEAVSGELFIWIMETLTADKKRKIAPAYATTDGMLALTILADEIEEYRKRRVDEAFALYKTPYKGETLEVMGEWLERRLEAMTVLKAEGLGGIRSTTDEEYH